MTHQTPADENQNRRKLTVAYEDQLKVEEEDIELGLKTNMGRINGIMTPEEGTTTKYNDADMFLKLGDEWKAVRLGLYAEVDDGINGVTKLEYYERVMATVEYELTDVALEDQLKVLKGVGEKTGQMTFRQLLEDIAKTGYAHGSLPNNMTSQGEKNVKNAINCYDPGVDIVEEERETKKSDDHYLKE